ncbi:MAG: sulfatase, partial [Candidatus Binatia bacterium]
ARRGAAAGAIAVEARIAGLAASAVVLAGVCLQRAYPRIEVPTPSRIALLVASATAIGWIARAGVLHARSAPFLGGLRNPAWAVVLLGGGLWLATARPWTPAPTNARNVLLVGIDTLRADRFDATASGQASATIMPHLGALAARGTVFRNAISQAPWTLPAFASILTGKYPPEHGAISLIGILRSEELTLAEVLREAGYTTRAVVSHAVVGSSRGFAQGFESIDERYALGHDAVTSARVTDAAIAALRTRDPRQPFFLFVHYFDPHYEYRDHRSWSFADAYDGWLTKQPLDINNLLLNRHLLDDADAQYLRDLYDEEIAYTDRHIGRLLAFLRDAGLEDDTLIIIVADHGEEFLEHGSLTHTTTLYEELIRVPLLIAPPAGASGPRFVDEPVETRAIFDTVIRHLGVREAPVTSARDLWPLLRQDAPRPQEDLGAPAFSTVWLPDAPLDTGKRVRLSAVRTRRWKLIVDHGRSSESLFDLAMDPGERNDLSGRDVAIRTRLRSLHDSWFEAVGAGDVEGPTRTLDREEVERLRALGYL